MPSPPKPWEVNNGVAASTPVVSQSVAEQHALDSTTSAPSIPSRPATGVSSLGTGTTMGTNYGGYGSTSYGSGYGTGYGTGGYGSYGSGYGTGYGSYGGYGSYNRMGYGGYGSSYGSYGMGGYNRFGMGSFGGGMYGPEGPESLTQRMESSTRATFDVIYSIVGAFGGFAQMLDSTYMATHSSFMAMVGVAEQFGNLKQYLGNILGIFALIRWVKKTFYKITGRTPPPELEGLKDENEQQQLQQGDQALQITENGESEPVPTEQEQQVTPTLRKRPIIIFLAIITGLPYLMYKLIQRSNEIRARQQRMMIPQYGGPPPELATVMYDFIGETPIELTIRRGDTIQVLSKVDPATGLPCEWWQGRLHNGSIGIFPANYVQIVN